MGVLFFLIFAIVFLITGVYYVLRSDKVLEGVYRYKERTRNVPVLRLYNDAFVRPPEPVWIVLGGFVMIAVSSLLLCGLLISMLSGSLGR